MLRSPVFSEVLMFVVKNSHQHFVCNGLIFITYIGLVFCSRKCLLLLTPNRVTSVPTCRWRSQIN